MQPVKREPMRTNINNGTDDGKGKSIYDPEGT
jgi:hypothetical protein